MLKNTLLRAGFKDLRFFDDGQQAHEYISKIKAVFGEDFSRDFHLLITDIEMPQLDGHTLTRRLKEDPIMKKLPVIIFSSLITGDLRHKGEAVGADAQLSKPEVGNLVELIDAIMHKVYGI